MSSSPIITVEHLSKRYRLGQIGARTLRDSAERFLSRFRGKWNVGSGMWEVESETSNVESGKSRARPPTSNIPPSTSHVPSPTSSSRAVSFEVQRGEDLGIRCLRSEASAGQVGRNGAGKSTLLKTLSRITEPTSGRAVRGEFRALREVLGTRSLATWNRAG